MFFGPKIIEEGALADVSGFGDVLDRGFQKSAFGKKAQRGAKQAFADLGAMALAAAALRQDDVARGGCGRCHEATPYVTDTRIRL